MKKFVLILTAAVMLGGCSAGKTDEDSYEEIGLGFETIATETTTETATSETIPDISAAETTTESFISDTVDYIENARAASDLNDLSVFYFAARTYVVDKNQTGETVTADEITPEVLLESSLINDYLAEKLEEMGGVKVFVTEDGSDIDHIECGDLVYPNW